MMIGVAPATDALLSFDTWLIVVGVIAVGIAVVVHNHWMHRKLRRHVTDTAQKP